MQHLSHIPNSSTTVGFQSLGLGVVPRSAAGPKIRNLNPFGGQTQGWKQHFGPRSGPSWPSWALLRYLEATAMLLGAKLVILRAC